VTADVRGRSPGELYPDRATAKRIAMLARERQAEALRVAVGLTLNDDRVIS
jgi:hypothetical protein